MRLRSRDRRRWINIAFDRFRGVSADRAWEFRQFDTEGALDELEVRLRIDFPGSFAGRVDLGEIEIPKADPALRGGKTRGGELGEVGFR